MIEKVTIIGSGPSAYQAYLYLKDLNPVLIEGEIVGNNGPGGQLTTTTQVDNYPCLIRINGYDLTELFKKHCSLHEKREKIVEETALEIKKEQNYFIIKTKKKEIKSYSVLLATGSSAKRLDVEGSDKFWMKGISSCAVCDGFAFMNKVIAVVGGGDSAMEEVLYLSSICKKVYLIHRRKEFRSRKDNLEKVKKLQNVKLLLNFVINKITNKEENVKILNENEQTENFNTNSDMIGGLVLEDVETKEKSLLKVDGLFYAIGHNPNSWFAKDLGMDMSEDGYIITNEDKSTSVKGIFASGDVQDKVYRQANTAASSGCVAALNLRKFLENKNLI